jgi:methylenetetrahydrofolate dehydrogenase (NADP+) / methenyltetrahydrofolate cyclohydrolase
MILLDGKLLSEKLAAQIGTEVSELTRKGFRKPHLAAVLIGDNPASKAYVGNKIRLCEKVGYTSTLIHQPESISQEALLNIVHQLNADQEIDGYIVQLPLPKHIDEDTILLQIDATKDVDGFHPINIGRMTLGLPGFRPATPYGIMMLLEHYHIPTQGMHCVVIGRSNIVGTPISIMLSRKGYPGDCTVTVTHSKTRNMPAIVKEADIVIAAIGIPEFVKGDWIKEGATVIDVGINKVEVADHPKGYKLVGDVAFEEIIEKCYAITPVPGGVGPMTVMALIMNTLKAYKNTFNL